MDGNETFTGEGQPVFVVDLNKATRGELLQVIAERDEKIKEQLETIQKLLDRVAGLSGG